MVDRKARHEMATVIRSYMEDRTRAFDLDESLWQIARRTKDRTVDAVHQLMWFHYDDLVNHKIVAAKDQWKYFNRLLLILDSDADLELIEDRYPRPFRRVVAASLLVGYVVVLASAGLGWAILAYSLACGVISMLLYRYASGRLGEPSKAEIALTPFTTFGEIRSLRRRVMGFSRRPYPEAIGRRRIRNHFVNRLYTGFMWLLCPPLFLFIQLFPGKILDTRLTISEQTPAASTSS